VKGVDGVSNADVRAVMDTAKGRPVATFRVENDARKIERLYRLKGYHSSRSRRTSPTPTRARSSRSTCSRARRSRWTTSCSSATTTWRARSSSTFIATHERGFLGLKGGEYVEETLIKDRTSLVNVYRREGYLNAQVLIDDVQFNAEKTRAYITIRITEGPPFTMGRSTSSAPTATRAARTR